MRVIRATIAAIACLGAGAGCSFRAPGAGADASAGADAPAADAPGSDAPFMPACLTDPSYSNSGTHRYKVITQSLEYDAAIDRCAADGAHLAVVETQSENTYLAGRIGGNTWIGFDDLTQEGAFRWITGAAMTFDGWSIGEPNDSGIEDCTYLRTNRTWNDASCAQLLPAICECDPEYRPPATPACRTAAGGFVIQLGRRYFARAAQTWSQAEADCAAIGAHLTAIGDGDENTTLDASLSGAHWIGYTDAAVEGTFRWSNGATSAFDSWGGGAPANDLADCTVLQDAGTWLDLSCEESHPYVCECDPAPP